MGENIFGKNIKYMRKSYGFKQDAVGKGLHMGGSTIGCYETGVREPSLDSLNAIAKYFGKTTDELLNVKLYEGEEIDSKKIINVEENINILNQLFPVIEIDSNCNDPMFIKGVLKIKYIIDAISIGKNVKLEDAYEAIETFTKVKDEYTYEACANILWCIFFIWNSFDENISEVKKSNERLFNGFVDRKEAIEYKFKREDRIVDRKNDFIEEFIEPTTVLIKYLKETEQWSQLGDYYLALRYFYCMIRNGYPDGTNNLVGANMLHAFAKLDNKYAVNFLKLINEQ